MIRRILPRNVSNRVIIPTTARTSFTPTRINTNREYTDHIIAKQPTGETVTSSVNISLVSQNNFLCENIFIGDIAMQLSTTMITMYIVEDDTQTKLLHQIPAYVSFTTHGILVGEEAKRNAATDPQNTIYDIIQLLDNGVTSHDYPFTIIEKDGNCCVAVSLNNETKHFTITDICAMLFREVRRQVEVKLGKQILDVPVLIIPTHFDDSKRQQIKGAARIAGMNVARLMNKSTMVGKSYGIEKYASD
jgi:hypothetical protein